MLSVDLLYLGNEKDENYNKAAEEYGKRLSAFCTFRGKNIKDERLPEDPSEKEIERALEKEAKDSTKLIVAQRIGTIRDADLIIVLDRGVAVGQGTHEELLKTCPVYREIALSQLSKEELGL